MTELTVSSRCLSPICYEWTITGPSLDELQREILILGSDYAVVERRWSMIEPTETGYRVTGRTIVKPWLGKEHERAWAKIMEMRASM